MGMGTKHRGRCEASGKTIWNFPKNTARVVPAVTSRGLACNPE